MTEPDEVDRGAIAAAGVVGLAGVLLYLVAAALIFDLPKMDDPGSTVRAYLVDHRARVLVATVTWTVATLATVALMAGLYRATAVGRWRSWAAIALLGGLLLSAMELVAFALLATAAYRDPGSPETARALVDAVFIALALAGVPSALWVAAGSAAMVGVGIGRRWIAALGLLTAVVHVGAACALARSGFWSPSGPLAYVAPVTITAWTFFSALLLLTSKPSFPGRRFVCWLVGSLA